MRKEDRRIQKLENKVEEMKVVLKQINDIVISHGLKYGSDDYFKVRGLCVDTIRETDMRMVDAWE